MQQDKFHAFTGADMGRRRGSYKHFTTAEQASVWTRWRAGENPRGISSTLALARSSVQTLLARHGGITPRRRTRAEDALSLAEREEISRGLAGDESVRAIARRLNRSP